MMPETFGRRFLLFVDTEEEFDWSAPPDRAATGTSAIAALPDAHRRFRDHGVAPIYLVDYPVANCAASVAAIRPLADADECDIGAQLHPWVNPPFDEELTVANSFVGNLPRELERAKLATLTQRIRDSFGRDPVVYRAGRYGVGPNSAALVEEAGYRLDVSARALFDYRVEGGPNFLRHPVRPWWAGPGGTLLALPLTAAFTGRGREGAAPLYKAARRVPFGRSLLARGGWLNRVALTPEGIPVAEAVEAVRRLIEDDVRLFSLSFHSPSLVPGHTPYVRDAGDLARFWDWWDRIFALFQQLDIRAARPADLLDAAWAGRRR